MLIVSIILDGFRLEWQPKLSLVSIFFIIDALALLPPAQGSHAMNARLTPASATDPNSTPFGCRSPRTGNSRRIRACWRAPKGMYYWTADGREVLDGVAGLWCVNAGHGRREITEAVTQQLDTMEFAPTFQMGHPIAFELANRLAKIAPPGPGPDLLHQFRFRVRRYRAENCHRLPSRARCGPTHALDRPREGLSRRGLRRHVGRRHGEQSQVLRRPRCCRASITCRTPWIIGHNAFSRGTAAVGRASGQ